MGKIVANPGIVNNTYTAVENNLNKSNFQSASLLYTFSGTASTSVTLAENAYNFPFIMALVLDGSNVVIGSAFLNPVVAHNREVKIYCGTTSTWGSFKLTDNGAKCTFNRTSSNTQSILFYGVARLYR